MHGKMLNQCDDEQQGKNKRSAVKDENADSAHFVNW
jgi:hypothetical protein